MDDKDDATIKLARDRLTWEHIAFAFALTGPYGAKSNLGTSQLNPKSVLSVLRSMLTTWVLLTDPTSLRALARANEDCARSLSKAFSDDPAVKGAWRELPSTEKSLEGLHVKVSTKMAKEVFFGVDEALGQLLTSRTPLHINQGTSDLYASSAHRASRSMLAGHPKRMNFQSWIAQSTDVTRSASNFNASTKFGILDFLQKGTEWSFWLDWYSHVLKGRPLDFNLQLRIAEIPDEDWKLGPEHIAKRINETRTEFESAELHRPNSVPELEAKQLIQHVQILLSEPEMTTLASEGLAASIEQAISDFLVNAPANCLPDELEHLNGLPPILRSIATVVRSNEEANAKTQALVDEIKRLNTEVARLEAALGVANQKSLNGRFKIKAIETAGMVFGSGAWLAPLAFGTCHFFGVAPTDITYENLRVWLDNLQNAEPLIESAPPNWNVTTEA